MRTMVHFSKNSRINLSRFISYQSPQGGPKPAGFWFSVEGREDGWWHWCHDEEFYLKDLTYAYPVTITPRAKILRIDTPPKMDRFHTKFNSEEYGAEWIDWEKVAESYQGLIIAPYSWSHRLDPRTNWYYSWDCASGCVWDPAAIEIPLEGRSWP